MKDAFTALIVLGIVLVAIGIWVATTAHNEVSSLQYLQNLWSYYYGDYLQPAITEFEHFRLAGIASAVIGGIIIAIGGWGLGEIKKGAGNKSQE